ncbi:MAG: hypothetical protein GY917_21125 [Planctomycetaceae bacterium]|nr:hypothetical protein [Planctomycetaceae bacterium]
MQNPSQSPQNTTSSSRARQFIRAACWAALLTVLVSICVLVIRIRGGMSSVDADTLAAAEKQWELAQVMNYDLEVDISERHKRRLRIQVRDSQITALWRNDLPIQEYRGYQAWTIEGMFQTIRTDVNQQLQLATPTPDTRLNNLTVRASFNPTHGFPDRYIRIEHRQQGNNPEISWKVISFKPHKS